MNIIFQPANHFGLGHVSRLLAIASVIRDRQPEAQVAFVLEGEGAHPLLDSAGFPYLALPESSHFCDDGIWTKWKGGDSTTVPFALAVAAIDRLQPDAIVFDSFPYMPMLRSAVSFGVPVVLCARQTRNDRAYFRNISAYSAMLQLLLLPHEPGTVDVPIELVSRSRYVGTIIREPIPNQRHRATDSPADVIVTGGGGGIPRTVDFYNLAIAAFVRCRAARHPGLTCTLVAGPLFHEWRELCLADGVRVVPYEPNLQMLMAAARLVVCRAGYNTTAELAGTSVPCISVPATTTQDDQVERARDLAARSPLYHTYLGNDPQTLAELVDKCLTSPIARRQHAEIRGNGAQLAATAILDMIGTRTVLRET